MTEITILTGLNRFVLDDGAAADLLGHIRSAGGQDRELAEAPVLAAIESSGAHDVRWTDAGKHGALHAIKFGYKPAGTSDDVFGCEISRRGYVTEVSLLSPRRTPAEPLAKVLNIRRDETPARATKEPEGEVSHGAQMIRRPNIGKVLRVDGRNTTAERKNEASIFEAHGS